MTQSYEPKWTIMSQEQLSQRQSLGELRLALNALLHRLEALEQRVNTLQAAHETAVLCGALTPTPKHDEQR